VKKIIPTLLGNIKSLSIIFRGFPIVVFIRILFIEKTVIKKKQEAKAETIIIFLNNLVLVLDTKRFATIAIENPPSKALIVSIWSAISFQYSNVISVISLLFTNSI